MLIYKVILFSTYIIDKLVSKIGIKLSNLIKEPSEKVFDSQILYKNFDKWDKRSSKKVLKSSKAPLQQKSDNLSRIRIKTGHTRYRSEVNLSKTQNTHKDNLNTKPQGFFSSQSGWTKSKPE